MNKNIFMLLGLLVFSLQSHAQGVLEADEMKKENARFEHLLNQEREQLSGETPSLDAQTKATEFCVSAPLPSTPSGQVWQGRWTSFGDVYDVKVWRVGCDAKNSNVLIRIEPVTVAPFICSSLFVVLQGGDQFDSTFITDGTGGLGFCNDLFVPKTFLMEQYSFKTNFNDDAAFTLVNSYTPAEQIKVGAYGGQLPGCSQGGIATYEPSTGVVNIPAVELPSEKCYDVNMIRTSPDALDFSVIKATPTN